MDSYKILLLAFMVATSQAGPICKKQASEEKNCALTCSDHNKFNYELGYTYEYSYNAETRTQMNGVSEDSAFMVIDAFIEIEPITKCDLIMRISDATLQDSGDALQTQTFKEALMKQPVKFSFQDGRIDHICEMDGESTWSLNIKKGILSAFQSSMDSFDRSQNLTETDVVGTCLTEYDVTEKDPRTKLVEKTKNLLGCTDREDYNMAVQSIGYNVPSFVKSLPLLKSEYKCTQVLNLGAKVLQSSTCHENHVFRPFSYGENGAMTTTEQTLTFSTWRKTENKTADDPFKKRSTLLFHHHHHHPHPHDTPNTHKKEEKIKAKLQELCRKAAEDIHPEVPDMFNQLIEHMRHVDRDALLRIYKKISQKKICDDKNDRIKQYFLDAIPMVGTAASVGVIEDLISKKEVIGGEAEMWLLSLSFIHHPTKEMVAAIMPLLDEPSVSGNTLLAVSSLASSYCNVKPDCGKDSEISALIKKLMDLTNNCNTKNGDARRIVFALRALGNIGRSHVAVAQLTRCSTRRDVPVEIRISAMDAFRRVPCDAMKSDLMGVFRDESEDSELRLNAYIALMKCPSKNVLSEVREVLEKEKSNQVGSFVWTHLTNLMETSDPHMQDIRNIVKDEELKKEFNLDQRKFSRNYEGSFFLDSINTGAKVDSNVIFSDKSFIPRSANLNLTIDLFGHAINLFEFGGRVQGMEGILQKCFLPNMKSGDKPNVEDIFSGSAFLRVFGNELHYWDDKSLKELQSSLRRLMNMQAVSFSKTMQLLDSRIIVPTCAGLPLSLTMSATGSISLDAKASFQKSKRELNIDFKPRASVEVKGKMTVDAHVSRAGLKMVTVAHTSTGAKIDIRKNKFDLQIPQKKMEILNLKTDFYIIHRNAEKKQKMIDGTEKKHEICTGNLMKQVTGLTFCQNVQFPNTSLLDEGPFFPFTGPVVYDLYMMNEDAPNGYQIGGFIKQSIYSFYMDTPNSKVSRRIALDTVMKGKDEAEITFTAPWENIHIKGTVVNTDEMKKLTGKVSLNGRTDYTLNAELGMKDTNGLLSLTPKFELTIPKKKMTYEGNIEVRPKKTLMIDMSAKGFTASDFNLKGSVINTDEMKKLSGELSLNGRKEYAFNAELGMKDTKGLLSFTPKFEVTIPKKKMTYEGKIEVEPMKSLMIDMSAKGFTASDVHLKVSGENVPKEIGLTAQLKIGKEEYYIATRLGKLISESGFELTPSLKITIPGKDLVDFNSEIIYEANKKMKFDFKLEKVFSKTVAFNFLVLLNDGNAKKVFALAVLFKSPQGNFRITGDVNKKKDGIASRFIANYNFGAKYSDHLILSVKTRDLSVKKSMRYVGNVALESKTKEFLNFNLKGKLAKTINHLETKVDLHHGNRKIKTNHLKFNCVLNRVLKPTSHAYDFKMTIHHPGQKINYKVEVKHVQSPKWPFTKFENTVMVQMAPGKVVETKVSYNNAKVKDLPTHEGEISLSYPGRNMRITDKLTEVNENTYENHFTVQWQKGREAAVKSTYTKTGRYVHDIENTLILPDKKEAKADAMLQVMPGDYKVKVQFDADEDIISRERIKAEGEATYNFNTKQVLGDLKGEVMWAPDQKISATINFDHMKKSSLGGKLVFSTPFDAMKNFDSDAKFTWDNGKYTTKMFASWNNQNELKQDFSFVYPDFHLLYHASALLSGKKSELHLSIKYSDVSLNSNIKVIHDKTTIIDFILKHNAHKMGFESEMGFDFDILDSDGKMEITLKYDKQKGEVMSNGKGKLNLQSQKLGASYNLKHNRDVSSIDLSYSSSLGKYKNGKMTFEMKRNLPKMLKSKMDLTLNDKLLFNINANYERQNGNIDMKIDIAEPSGQKITVSGNINFSGSRKTGKVELKSRYINLSVDGAFEYKGTHFADGELKMTIEGKRVMIKANYEKYGSTYTVTGTLGLPDGKSVTIRANYKKEGSRYTVTGTLGLPDGRSVMIKADYKNEGPTYKVTGTLRLPDGRSLKMEGNLDLQKIAASLKTMSPDFPELTEIDMDFSFKGDKRTFSSVASLKVMPYFDTAQAELTFTKKQVTLDIKSQFESMKQATVTVTFDGDWVQTEKVKAVFELNNKLMFDMEISYNFKSLNDFFVSMSALTSHKRYNEFKFDLKNKGPLSDMNVFSQIKLNKDKYELTFSNEGYYEQINTKLDTPYFKSTIKFSLIGNLEKFKLEFGIHFNEEIYEMEAFNEGYFRQMDFLLNTPVLICDFHFEGDLENAKGTLTVLYGDTKYDLTFSNKNFFKDYSLVLTIPKHVLEINGGINIEKKTTSGNVNIIYNKKKLSLSGIYKDLGQEKFIKTDLKIPYFKNSLTAVFNGKPKKFNAQVKLDHNEKTYELTLSNKNFYEMIDMDISTPEMKAKLDFEGDLEKFKSLASVNISNDMYRFDLSNENYVRNIKMELTTPQTGKVMLRYDFVGNLNIFKLTSQFSYRKNKYEINAFRNAKSGEHWLTIVSPQIDITIHIKGDLKNLSFDANATLNKQKYELMASNKNYFREISGKLTTPQLGEQSLSVKINGELRDFDGSIEVKNNKEMYKCEFSFKNQEFRLSLSKWLKKLLVKLDGDWKNFELTVKLMNYKDEKIEFIATKRNFQEMKAHLAISHFDDINVSVKTSGNLKKGRATMKISYGKHIFENEVEIILEDKKASFEIEPQYKILGRSGKANLKIDLMFEDQYYDYEFEADIEGIQVKSTASLKISPEIVIFMTVNIPTSDASKMKLHITSNGFEKTQITLNLKSPWTGMVNVFYKHKSQTGKSFNTKGFIERDSIRLAGYSLDMDFSGQYSFDFTCVYGNSKDKIETKAELKFQGVKTKATLSVNTPFRLLKEVFIVVHTKMLRDEPSIDLDVKLPNQHYSLHIDLSDNDFNALLNLNMDKKNENKQCKFKTSYKNTDQGTDISRNFDFKMIIPERTVSLDTRFENTQRSVAISSHLAWGEAKAHKSGFELMIEKHDQKKGKLRIITPHRTVELFGALDVDGNHYSTVGHLITEEDKKIAIKADIVLLEDRVDIDLNVKFPDEKKRIHLKSRINLPKDDLIFSSTSEFSMDQDPKKSFKMSTKLMSVTKGKRQMYTMHMDAGHVHSGFLSELIGHVSSSPEKYNADIEIGYLSLNHKQQKFAVRGKLHRFNHEANLKLEAPSKTIELDGSLCTENKYMINVLKKESGKKNMKALFKLDPKSQRMNIIFNVDEANPNKLYRIDAYNMKSKAIFKAYLTNKQRRQSTDGRISVELKTDNLFQSHIKWNPRLLEELNMYGTKKLNLYRKELRHFGNSLIQVLNDEVSMKLSLVKQSFSEDMASVVEDFETIYDSLLSDFTAAMQDMNEVFDSFCIKSVIEAIGNVFNHNKYLIDLKQGIENFNADMGNKMDEARKQLHDYYDQFSMQVVNKVNELLEHSKEWYKMVHERAMKMNIDILSLVKNTLETSEELIDRMRSKFNEKNVKKYMNEIYEIFNKQIAQAKKHMDTLKPAINSAHATLKRHIDSARRYPIVDAIMDAIDKAYQKALWSYNYWDVKDNLLELKDNTYGFGAKKIKEIKDIITDVDMNTLVFDPKRGEIIVEIRFGAAKYFYDHFMSSVEDLERAVMKLKNLKPNFNLNVWDIYYMMKPSSDIEDYIPAFKAQATLFAGKYITTFDGRHFIYKSECSYLLTRDAVHNSFNVIANFYRDPKGNDVHSISVRTSPNDHVEIFPDNKVKLNKRVAKLPLKLAHATVTHQGNLIVFESELGFKVIIDNDIQLYTVQINGCYFNKVSGLFGNFNNKPSDDLPKSNGEKTDGDTKFIWSENRPCEHGSHGKDNIQRQMVPKNTDCDYYFLQSGSPFRYCFKQVNPVHFYKTCAMQLRSSNKPSTDLCNVTSFYQKKCEKKGVYLSTPAMCPKKT